MTGTPFSNTRYLLKPDSAGNFQLARNFVRFGPVTCYDLDLDASGNVYLAGNFAGTMDLDPEPAPQNTLPRGTTALC